MNKIKSMWKKATQNEKIMYALILVSVIGISTRWAYVKTEVADGVTGLFGSDTTAQQAEQKSVKEGSAPVFSMQDPPAMLPNKDAQKWIATNFWKQTNPTDYLLHADLFKQLAFNWSMTLHVLSNNETSEAVNALFEKVKGDKATVEMLLLAMEDVLYDPSIPARNFDELEKERPKSQLSMALKNRVGTKALDFNFITINGQKSSLYKVKAKYTVLFINNPGCPACAEYKKALTGDAGFMQMIDGKEVNATDHKDVKVLAVFPDASETDWRKYSVDMPQNWINGFDYSGTIKKNDIYDCSAIPSMYLLDSNKIVLLKDVNPTVLVRYLQLTEK